MILVDTIAHHKKFLLAGQLIGGQAGAARALAVYVAAIGYAREGLTDGVVHDVFLDKFGLDSGAKKVAKVLASRTVRLFHRVKTGYKIHDFHKHNDGADKLRHQRELARERKRRQRAKEAVENFSPQDAPAQLHKSVTRDMERDSRARVREGEGEGDRNGSTSNARDRGEGSSFFQGTFTGNSTANEPLAAAAGLAAGSSPSLEIRSFPSHVHQRASVPTPVRHRHGVTQQQPATARGRAGVDGGAQGSDASVGVSMAVVGRGVEGDPRRGIRAAETHALFPVQGRATPSQLTDIIAPLKAARTPLEMGRELRALAQRSARR